MSLPPETQSLLESMMATIGSIWAIGFVAYQFIYQYFEKHHRSTIDDIKKYMASGADSTRAWNMERRKKMYRRLGRYYATFTGYLIAGFFTVACIIVAGAAIVTNNADIVPVAGALFVIALGLLGAFLSIEVLTSIGEIRDARIAVDPTKPPGGS